MARLGPTHGANTGSRARIIGYIRYFRMYRKAVQRAESIGGFIRDEIMIALGDMAQNLQKTTLRGWMQS